MLGEQSWAAIERNQAKYRQQYKMSEPCSSEEILDFCYLGQLAQLMQHNQAWAGFKDAFRDKRQLEDLINAIVPVRNDAAHFRTVPDQELDRCRVAVRDLKVCLNRVA
jgi:hypothetical protein